MPFDASQRAEVDDVALWAARLRGARPEVILERARAAFPQRLALVSSFGTESAVLLHLTSVVDRSIPVLFLDTGQLFAQTLDYRKRLAADLGLVDVRDLRPAFADLAVEDPSADLWRHDADRCCDLRKVRPLDLALEGFDAWITGRKRFQSTARARLAPVERGGDGRVKFNPLVAFGPSEIADYIRRHALPDHPLKAFGYPSVGCWPCTTRVAEGDDSRAGRWAGLEKTECGIHRPQSEPNGGHNVGGDI